MTDWNEQFPEHWEAANLPVGDPAREELESKLAGMEAEERGHWENVLRETDLFYGQMSQVNLPEGMEQGLLKIANEPAGGWREILRQPIGWKHLAACVVIAIGVAAYIYWPSGGVQPLNQSVADRIAMMAVADHQKPRALEISSNDPAKVEAALAGHQFGFGAMVPQPAIPLELLGGGVAHFDKTPVIFTRWKGGEDTYTLYQFDPKQAGVPDSFVETVESPKELWHGKYHYEVLIEPGTDQQGAWAVVMEKQGMVNPFPVSAGVGCR